LGDLSVDGRVLLKEILQNKLECVDLICLAYVGKNMVQWRACMNTVMNLRVLYKAGIS
jgi:hypothetical protein